MIAQILKELINVSHDFVVQILKISGLNECMTGSIIFICEIKYCLIKKKKIHNVNQPKQFSMKSNLFLQITVTLGARQVTSVLKSCFSLLF